MQIKQLYIKAELDGSISEGLIPEDSSWIPSDRVRIIAEPGHILLHNGICYGANVVDTQDTEGWTEALYIGEI